MRHILFSLLAFHTFALASLGADDVIPFKIVNQVKRASVFIKIDTADGSVTGSGFVINKTGASALIATNRHVIEPGYTMQPTPSPTRRPRTLYPNRPQPRDESVSLLTIKHPKATVVFFSGTKEEITASAEVVAVDPRCDLAVLEVSDVKGLPDAIDVVSDPNPVETMAVYAFGFPFGKSLAIGGDNPAITVSKASVSSLRRDDRGELALIQIDGSLNPGNSGGPIVDTRGLLVGVAVATIRNGNGIGLAVPGTELRQLVEGRHGHSRATCRAGADGKTTARFEVHLADPLKKINSMTVHFARVGSGQKELEAADKVESLPGSAKRDLKIEKMAAWGEWALASARSDDQWYFQAEYKNGLGKIIRTAAIRTSLSRDSMETPRQTSQAPPVIESAIGGETKLIGGGFGGESYRDVAPKGYVLVGVEVGLGKFANFEVIRSVRAVFRDGDKESEGPQRGTDQEQVYKLLAKPGYAVGAATIKAGANADALSLTFMRIKGDKLDPSDAYESEWVGDNRPGGRTVLTGNGRPIVGISGKANDKENTGLGLLLKQ